MWCLYFETEGQEVVSLFIFYQTRSDQIGSDKIRPPKQIQDESWGVIWAHFGCLGGSFGLTFNVLGCHWDSVSETLGSEGVKGYLSPLLLGSIESHFGDLSIPVFRNRPPFCIFKVTSLAHSKC